jgi:transaldolase
MLQMQSLESPVESPAKQAFRLGQSLWYDGLLTSRQFQTKIEQEGIRGATTNPAIFEKALSSPQFSAAIRRLRKRGFGAEAIYRQLSIEAVQGAADVFRPVYDQSGGEDGYVSIEVSPLLAYDTKLTISQAKELFWLIDRKNVMIKIPATKEGLPAIEALVCHGIAVNATLIFSVSRYREVAQAYITGLKRRLELGGSLREVSSVASVFVSRLDTEVDKLLQAKMDASHSMLQQKRLKTLMGKAAVANAKIVYGEFEKIFLGPSFEVLRSRGARRQRPLWASTGTKNPLYRDVMYVESLLGPHTVNTVPPSTLEAFQHHGSCKNQICSGLTGAHETIRQLKEYKIPIDQITCVLEEGGVRLFCDSYNKILQRIEENNP